MSISENSVDSNSGTVLTQEINQNRDPVYLPISAVAEVIYCPRNFYYRMIEGANEENHHMMEGRLQEERRNLREHIKREGSLQIRSVAVSSEMLGLTGVVDVLEMREDIHPVEYKKGALRDNINDDVQLCAQAMVLEEELGNDLRHGFIYYGESRARREVFFTGELRELVQIAINRAREIIESNEIPAPLADHRCRGCSLAPRCLPEEVNYLKKHAKLPVRPVPSLNMGRVLYIDRQGASVRKKSERIVVYSDEEIIFDVPICNIDQLVLVGGVNLSTPVMKKLLDTGINVTLLSSRGAFRGSLEPPFSRNSVLRIAQYRTYFDDSSRLVLARQFVRGKLANMRTIIMRYNRKIKDGELSVIAKELGVWAGAAATANDIPSLLGIEGMGSRAYFKAFSRLIKPGVPFNFERRSRRPPGDPVNAMLGLGYSLLSKDLKSSLETVGFDPYIGYYHESKYGRHSLALDLMEEFRSIVVDSVVLSLLNQGTINENDFEYRLGGCFLNDSGRNKFYRAYEERKRQQIEHPVFKYRMAYNRMFELQARFLAKVIQGELEQYEPFIVR